MIIAVIVSSCTRVDDSTYYEEGVSRLLAMYRSATVTSVSYRLFFSIPGDRETPVTASSTTELKLKSKREPLLLDFRVPAENLGIVIANGDTVQTSIDKGHIVIPKKYLHRGYNRIITTFTAGDLSLNRNDDFLYTLFVPDRACTAFPCFDQPDLKAVYNLTLEIPLDYKAISNSPVISSDTTEGRITLRFDKTKPLSTYLFAFAAGRFERVEYEMNGIRMEMLHREKRAEYLSANIDDIFRLHYNSVKWLEDYTGIEYPFDKFGFVLIPSFQYNGMEHPGSICYRASSLFLDPNSTLNEKLQRAGLIAHETSHIWFGDLVTMKWFDDVWLKEVFAGYMSDKIVSPDFPDINHDLRFYLSRYPAAYSVDRTRGSNPIIQELGNMKDAGSLYGAIIYNKAPIVMRMLEQKVGETGLREALRVYLKEYSWSNATWNNLVTIIESESGQPLKHWSSMWTSEAGMPMIRPVITSSGDLFNISFEESDPYGKDRHWPQTLTTSLISSSDTVTGTVMPGDKKSILSDSLRPLCVLPDISGRAYGTFLLDPATISFIASEINGFSDPLVRGITWVNLNENLINNNLEPYDFYRLVMTGLAAEKDEQITSYLTGRLISVWWDRLTNEERDSLSGEAEAFLWNRVTAPATASQQRIWFSTFRNITVSEKGLGLLERVWETGNLPGDNTIAEDDRSAIALTLSLKRFPEAAGILDRQRESITDPDRRKRFEFVLPAVSPVQEVRDSFFLSLSDPVNREHEPWVLEALGYLHHPLVADSSVKYILPSLEMLEEIKQTGDIFFPGGWATATLSGHHSPEARDVVLKFLADHPDYPPDLNLKILQAADHLLRIK